MRKNSWSDCFLTLVLQPVYKKEIPEFKRDKIYLKTDLVSLPAVAEGLVNI